MKAGSKVFNVFWIIFVGIWTAIDSAITGALCCMTIIGIPLGLQHFKFIKLAFAPAGRRVVLRYGSHPVLNTLWLLFGGLEVFLLYILLGALCCCTIVGIPLGKQLFKIATFNLGPFGCTVVVDGEYSETKDTYYDMELLAKRLYTNPDVPTPRKNDDGTPVTVRQVLKERSEKLCLSAGETVKQFGKFYTFSPLLMLANIAVMVFVGIIVGNTVLQTGNNGILFALIPIGVGLVVIDVVLSLVNQYKMEEVERKETLKCIGDLVHFYPAGSPIDRCFTRIRKRKGVNLAMIYALIPWSEKIDEFETFQRASMSEKAFAKHYSDPSKLELKKRLILALELDEEYKRLCEASDVQGALRRRQRLALEIKSQIDAEKFQTEFGCKP